MKKLFYKVILISLAILVIFLSYTFRKEKSSSLSLLGAKIGMVTKIIDSDTLVINKTETIV